MENNIRHVNLKTNKIMKQTAVEFLEKELNELLVLFSTKWDKVNKAIDEAKEMEQKQLKEMYLKGIENYDPTFKNK
jgi:phosphoribosylaminoimidazole-succinocarboxamide synthase